MDIKIDLNKSDRRKHPISNLALTPDISKFNWIQRMVYNRFGGKKAAVSKIWIQYEMERTLKIKDEGKIFYFFHGNETYDGKIENLDVASDGHNIEIGLDLSQVEDVDEAVPHVIPGKAFPLSYEVFWKDKKGREHHTEKETVDLNIKPFNSKSPELEGVKNLVSSLSGDPHPLIEHKIGGIDGSRKKLWELAFVNPSPLVFSNPVSGNITLTVKEGKETVQEGFFLEGDAETGADYFLNGLVKGKTCPVYIGIDFTKHSNPPNAKHLDVYIKQKHVDERGDAKEKIVFEGELTIEPDSQKTELAISLLFNHENVLNNIDEIPEQPIRISKAVTWSIDDNLNHEIVNLRLINKAKNSESQGQVDIKNFRFDFCVEHENGKMLSEKGWLEGLNDAKPEFSILNGEKPFEMKIAMAFKKIYKALPDEVSASILIYFDYREDSYSNLKWKPVEIKIDFSLQRYIDRCLALDFGTSAIAAALYDPDLRYKRDKITFLDLNKIHEEILHSESPDGDKLGEFDEQGTEFLSSLMYLDVEEVNQEQAGEDAHPLTPLTPQMVKFSPLKAKKTGINFRNRVLPNLKILLGHDSVSVSDASGIGTGSIKLRQLDVNDILKSAYKLLFGKYIVPSILDKYRDENRQYMSLELLKTFGNIVITIPNMFNQTHQRILRDLIERDITWDIISDDLKISEIRNRKAPLFFKDQIKFISESDAVACYYINRWKKFNPGREGNPSQEYVLIYDLGAGTVDISYLRVVSDECGGDLKIESLGNVGALKAGNSLDTLIAKIINRKTKDKRRYELFTDKEKNFSSLVSCKDFIKNYFKIALSKSLDEKDTTIDFDATSFDDTRLCSISDFNEAVSSDSFKGNPLFDSFLNDITKKILKNLFDTVDENHKVGSKLKVDKVIVSGRCSRFKPVFECFKETLESRTTIDSDDDNQVFHLPDDDLKKAVAKGALDYYQKYQESFLKPLDINSYYGIFWQNVPFGSDIFTYKELLRPGNRPEVSDDGEVSYDDSDQLYVMDVGEINLKHADDLVLIKSFSSDPIQEINADKSEMMTKILRIRKRSLQTDPAHTPVKLKFNSDVSQLRLRAHNTETDPSNIEGMSLEQDLTYEESTWPLNHMFYLIKEQDSFEEKQNEIDGEDEKDEYNDDQSF